MEELEKIIELDNEVIAKLIESVLLDRDIPHIIRTYHDSAYDGLFAYQKGWGVLQAPSEYRDEIIEIFKELNDQQTD